MGRLSDAEIDENNLSRKKELISKGNSIISHITTWVANYNALKTSLDIGGDAPDVSDLADLEILKNTFNSNVDNAQP